MFRFFKNRNNPRISVLKYKLEFEKTFTTLIMLLRENTHEGQANFVESMLKTLINDQEDKVIKALKSVDMWGGSGAVWEVGYFKNKKEEIEFMCQIVNLIDLMKKSGLSIYNLKRLQKLFKSEINKSTQIINGAP